jgi:hypothetical protein
MAMAAVLVAATAISAFGAIAKGSQESAAFGAQQQQAQYNAASERQQAQAAGAVGAEQEAAQRRKGALFLGEQAAAIGESGTGITSGSAQDVMRQSATFAAMDALNTRYEGQLRSKSFLNQSIADEYAAGVYGKSKQNAITGGYLGAGSAILSGAASYAGSKK